MRQFGGQTAGVSYEDYLVFCFEISVPEFLEEILESLDGLWRQPTLILLVEEGDTGQETVKLFVDALVFRQELVSNDGQQLCGLERIFLEAAVGRAVLLVHVYYQFDHEDLHDFIADSVPVCDLLIAVAVLLLQALGELLEPEIHVESHLDVLGVDVHHHVLQHQRLLHQVLVLDLPVLQLNLFVRAEHQELLRVAVLQQFVHFVLDLLVVALLFQDVQKAQFLWV